MTLRHAICSDLCSSRHPGFDLESISEAADTNLPIVEFGAVPADPVARIVGSSLCHARQVRDCQICVLQTHLQPGLSLRRREMSVRLASLRANNADTATKEGVNGDWAIAEVPWRRQEMF
eukprot:253238-Hanusia_phi.AAC.2